MVTQTTDQVKRMLLYVNVLQYINNLYMYYCIANLNLYLLDVVSGGVVYQVTHKLATVPINIVLCENWVVVSYY